MLVKVRRPALAAVCLPIDVMVFSGKPVSNHTPMGARDHVQVVRGGGIEWTIKDGIPYLVPTLMREVKEMVDTARERARPTTP